MEMAFSKVFKVTGEGRLLFLEAVTIMQTKEFPQAIACLL